ncbi:ankyrin repeat-containing domain [Cordyceps militaris CM01]|uniref:Ankyrin repeat-containing domain n=1 Tax=Cordyceps militaris (strain CM01) TaxID=983644 RepID=G3J551_CORMM|nr:ankyrin repeat-containing domain [Cordyceps militaris CM01]EGX95965.1 ankyrin repeat-containing domain [Cordyceps militaris CM01]
MNSSSLGQSSTSSSDKLRLPTLSLAGSSSDESTSPMDPGSYMDAASDIVPALDARPHSPSQSPLSSYFKTNITLDASMPESWGASSDRVRQEALPAAHECLSWPGSYSVHKAPAGGQQAAKQRALRIAVAHRQLSSVELLLKYGTDVNYIGDTGRTVLHDAAESNDGDMVRMLLERGANADLMDKAGITALEVASSLGNLEVAEILLKSSLG